MSFRNLELQALEPGKLVELTLNQLKGDPILIVEHLGETNTEFWNDAIARAGARAALGGKKLSKETVQLARQKNREIVAKYSVKGVKNIFHDAPGKPGVPDPSRPATVADISDIVASLPAEIFDQVLAFVSNAENFRETAPIETDAAELAGK